MQQGSIYQIVYVQWLYNESLFYIDIWCWLPMWLDWLFPLYCYWPCQWMLLSLLQCVWYVGSLWMIKKCRPKTEKTFCIMAGIVDIKRSVFTIALNRNRTNRSHWLYSRMNRHILTYRSLSSRIVGRMTIMYTIPLTYVNYHYANRT